MRNSRVRKKPASPTSTRSKDEAGGNNGVDGTEGRSATEVCLFFGTTCLHKSLKIIHVYQISNHIFICHIMRKKMLKSNYLLVLRFICAPLPFCFTMCTIYFCDFLCNFSVQPFLLKLHF